MPGSVLIPRNAKVGKNSSCFQGVFGSVIWTRVTLLSKELLPTASNLTPPTQYHFLSTSLLCSSSGSVNISHKILVKSIGAFQPLSLQGDFEYFWSQIQHYVLILLYSPKGATLFILSLNYEGLLHCGAQVLPTCWLNHKLESLKFLEYIFYSLFENRFRSYSFLIFISLSDFHIPCW